MAGIARGYSKWSGDLDIALQDSGDGTTLKGLLTDDFNSTSKAGGSSDAPGCTPMLGDTRLSISNECANTPFASAAIGACTFSDVPSTVLRPPFPYCSA